VSGIQTTARYRKTGCKQCPEIKQQPGTGEQVVNSDQNSNSSWVLANRLQIVAAFEHQPGTGEPLTWSLLSSSESHWSFLLSVSFTRVMLADNCLITDFISSFST
jgi:hypothetical protein